MMVSLDSCQRCVTWNVTNPVLAYDGVVIKADVRELNDIEYEPPFIVCILYIQLLDKLSTKENNL